MDEQEILAALDFKPALRCEAKFCNDLATHTVRMVCGHDAVALCAIHTTQLLDSYLQQRLAGHIGVCHVDLQRVTFDAIPIAVQ